MPPTKDRPYCRVDDFGPEGEVVISPGDKVEKEISALRTWLDDLDKKIDTLTSNGCAHRGNDLDKITRMEASVEGTRIEAGKIKDSVSAISMDMVRSSAAASEKVFNLKIWILANILILIVAVSGFLFREFVMPATVNPMRHVEAVTDSGDRSHVTGTVTIPQEQYKEIIDALIRAKEVDRPPGPQGHIPR